MRACTPTLHLCFQSLRAWLMSILLRTKTATPRCLPKPHKCPHSTIHDVYNHLRACNNYCYITQKRPVAIEHKAHQQKSVFVLMLHK